MSKLHLPFIETFGGENIFAKKNCNNKCLLCKKCNKNFCNKKIKIVKKKLKYPLKIRNQIVTKLKNLNSGNAQQLLFLQDL